MAGDGRGGSRSRAPAEWNGELALPPETRRTDAQDRRQIFIPPSAIVEVDASERRIRATASTPDVDRYRTIVRPEGMIPPEHGISLLLNHAADRIVGHVLEIERSAAGITIEGVISDDEVWDLVREKNLSGVSIGFLPDQWRWGEDDEPDEVLSWSLIEISLTPVPANPAARIEHVRSLPQEQRSMSERNEPVPAPRLVSSTPASPYLRKKLEPFSISRVISAVVNSRPLDGLEREITDELERRSDSATRGIRIPAAVFQKRALDTSPGSAGSLSQPVDYYAELLDDVSAARRWGTLTQRMGFTIISSIRENVSIPKRLTTLAAGWGPKDTDAGDAGDMTFGKDDLQPLYCKATTSIERSALRYTNPAVDQIVITDLANALHATIDEGVLYGAGTGDEPKGLLTAPSVTVPLGGRLATSTDLFAVKQTLATRWKMDGDYQLRWLLHPTSYDAFRITSLKTVPDDTNEWYRGLAPLEVAESTLLGLYAVQSGRVPVTVAGPPAQYNVDLLYPEMMVVVYFGGAAVDTIIDPFSLSQRGAVRISAFVDVNCICRDHTAHYRLSGVNSVVPQGPLPLAAPPAPPPEPPEPHSEPPEAEADAGAAPEPTSRRPPARPEGYGRR